MARNKRNKRSKQTNATKINSEKRKILPRRESICSHSPCRYAATTQIELRQQKHTQNCETQSTFINLICVDRGVDHRAEARALPQRVGIPLWRTGTNDDKQGKFDSPNNEHYIMIRYRYRHPTPFLVGVATILKNNNNNKCDFDFTSKEQTIENRYLKLVVKQIIPFSSVRLIFSKCERNSLPRGKKYASKHTCTAR